MPSRARYDENGNIIIPGLGKASEGPSTKQKTEPAAEEKSVEETVEQWPEETEDEGLSEGLIIEANTTHEPANEHMPAFGGAELWEEVPETRYGMRDRAKDGMEVLRRQAQELRSVASSVLIEGVQQYGTSAADIGTAASGVHSVVRNGISGFWAFLRQPVWVPGRKRPKQYSRGTLFFVDVLRFGGTFATLFGVLFLSMNYQSFWEIFQSRLDPLGHTELIQNLQGETDDGLHKALRTPSVGGQAGDLLSILPHVGPPANRLIIPKLGLNVPIVTPSNTNLLKQDWTALESDIQTSLQEGVVHYPGTAIAGQAGNFFITGHSSYYPFMPGKYKSVFARLHELSIGDEYWVYFGGDKHRYVVQSKEEVKPSDVKVLDQPSNQRLSTLMTCTPVGTTLRRLVLVSQEVDPVTGIALAVGEHSTTAAAPMVQVESLPI